MNSNQQTRNNGENYTTETDPLLFSSQPSYSGISESTFSSTSTIRERRPASAATRGSDSGSPIDIDNSYYAHNSNSNNTPSLSFMNSNSMPSERQQPSFAELPETVQVPTPYGEEQEPNASYEMYNDNDIDNSSRPIRSLRSLRSAKSQREAKFSRTFSDGRNHNDDRGDRLHQYYNERANRIFSEPPQPASDEPLVEVSEEILAVRKSALRVYDPLTYTWVSTLFAELYYSERLYRMICILVFYP
jgi:hypothetical protein